MNAYELIGRALVGLLAVSMLLWSLVESRLALRGRQVTRWRNAVPLAILFGVFVVTIVAVLDLIMSGKTTFVAELLEDFNVPGAIIFLAISLGAGFFLSRPSPTDTPEPTATPEPTLEALER